MGEYRRAELAEHSGVPARTIRYYHSVGVLPRPRRVGKEAVYDDVHVERLQQIGDMRSRGLQLDAIREVFDKQAGPATDWRSLFDPRNPFGADEHRFDDGRLTEFLGDRRDEILDDLVAHGYLARDGADWTTADYPALKGALMLYDLGTSVAVSASIWKIIRSGLAAIAEDVVDTLAAAAGSGYAGEGTRTDLSRFVDQFQAAAREVGGKYFADEITRTVLEFDR